MSIYLLILAPLQLFIQYWIKGVYGDISSSDHTGHLRAGFSSKCLLNWSYIHGACIGDFDLKVLQAS